MKRIKKSLSNLYKSAKANKLALLNLSLSCYLIYKVLYIQMYLQALDAGLYQAFQTLFMLLFKDA